MADSRPATTKQWTVNGTQGVDSLVFNETALSEIGDNQVLVKSMLSREFETQLPDSIDQRHQSKERRSTFVYHTCNKIHVLGLTQS